MTMKIGVLIRRMLVVGGLVWQSHSAVAQTDSFDLYVSYTDSVEASIDLASLRSLTFSYNDRTMTAHYRGGASSTHDYTRIGKMYFAIDNGIEEVELDEQVWYSLDGVLLELREEVQHVALYRLDGTLVMRITGSKVSLGGLPAGIYILRVDNKTAKICVR